MDDTRADVLMDRERIDLLEQMVLEMRDRERKTLDTLKIILDAVKPEAPAIQTQKSTTPNAVTSAPTSESSAPVGHPKMPRIARPAVPPDFDGDRAKGVAFLNACQTYLKLCSDEFPDEQTKTTWAMSYMRSGRAQRWTARIFNWEEQAENAGTSRFLDWEDFREEFRKEFTPAHADALALNKLETSAYHQKARTLDDYIDEFQDLITDSGYTDPKTIVVKFRRGLNSQIQNAVATMGVGRPPDTSPHRWYEMARTVDQNRATNEAFMSSSRPSAPSAPTRLTGVSFGRGTVPSALTPKYAHNVPTPGNPVPMDVDAARKKSHSDASCFRCGKIGHWGKNCPDRFDIRNLTTDELQEVLEGRLAQLDVVAENPDRLAESAPTEDFLPDSE
jgi:hypothetical protein